MQATLIYADVSTMAKLHFFIAQLISITVRNMEIEQVAPPLVLLALPSYQEYLLVLSMAASYVVK